MTLAERMLAIRTELDIKSCAQMGREAGLNSSNLRRVEEGLTQKLNGTTIRALWDAYKINPDYLRMKSDEMFIDGRKPNPKKKPIEMPLATSNTNNLDWLMGLSGMDNSKLSRTTAVPRGKIIELKVGRTPLDVNSAMSLAYFFDCDIEFLLGEDGFIKVYLPRIAEPLLLNEEDFQAISVYTKNTKAETGERIELAWGKEKKVVGGMKVIRILLPKYLSLLSTEAQIRAKLLYMEEEDKKELLSKI